MSEKKDLLETMVSEGIKRIIIIHHNDNDGLVGARMLYDWMYPKFETIIMLKCDYRDTRADWDSIIDNIHNFGRTVVFITDYNFPYEEAKKFENEPNCDMVFWRDHHKSAVPELDKILAHNFTKVNGIVDMKSSGTKLCYEMVMEEGVNSCPEYMSSPHVKKLVDLVWCYDINADPSKLDGWYLNAFTYKAMMNDVDSKMLSDLLYDESCFKRALRIGKRFYELNTEVNELMYHAFAKVCTFEGHRICIREGRGSSYSFGAHIKEYDAVAMYSKLRSGEWTISLFSDKPDFDGEPIATKYGGGGHAHACGWRSCFNPFADLECIPVDEDVARRMKNEH